MSVRDPKASIERSREDWVEADLEQDERRGKVLKLRNGGMSWKRIAVELNITAAQAMSDAKYALRSVVREQATDIVANQVVITRNLVAALYPNALRGDVSSVRAITDLLGHQARLLGLYAPARVDVAVTDEDFAATTAKMLRDIGIEPPKELMVGGG